MELVRTFPKGTAEPPPAVPWYEATVTYLLLVPAAISWFVTGALVAGYWACTDEISAHCVGGEVLRSSTGSYEAIVTVGAVLLGVSFVTATAAQLTVRKLLFPLVWVIAAISLGTSIYAYCVMSGIARTPWGYLIPY